MSALKALRDQLAADLAPLGVAVYASWPKLDHAAMRLRHDAAEQQLHRRPGRCSASTPSSLMS
jgi:hypothetical protein